MIDISEQVTLKLRLKCLRKAEKEIIYGPYSMSVNVKELEKDTKIKEISETIQKIWVENVRPRINPI